MHRKICVAKLIINHLHWQWRIAITGTNNLSDFHIRQRCFPFQWKSPIFLFLKTKILELLIEFVSYIECCFKSQGHSRIKAAQVSNHTTLSYVETKKLLNKHTLVRDRKCPENFNHQRDVVRQAEATVLY